MDERVAVLGGFLAEGRITKEDHDWKVRNLKQIESLRGRDDPLDLECLTQNTMLSCPAIRRLPAQEGHSVKLVDPTDGEVQHGWLRVRCEGCGEEGRVHLWGHSQHPYGTREYCPICKKGRPA